MVQTLQLMSCVPICSQSRTLISCSSAVSRNNAYIPKLEPFSRNKIDRAFKDPPLIEKSEKQISDYCSTLEGDDSYSCWKAYFELKDLEKEVPKEELERLIIEAGGVKSLIGCVHGVAAIHESKKGSCSDAILKAPTTSVAGSKHPMARSDAGRSCPVPDGLPKTWEELQEEEKDKMPDSPFTRLLRTRGRRPAWPEHQAD